MAFKVNVKSKMTLFSFLMCISSLKVLLHLCNVTFMEVVEFSRWAKPNIFLLSQWHETFFYCVLPFLLGAINAFFHIIGIIGFPKVTLWHIICRRHLISCLLSLLLHPSISIALSLSLIQQYSVTPLICWHTPSDSVTVSTLEQRWCIKNLAARRSFIC